MPHAACLPARTRASSNSPTPMKNTLAILAAIFISLICAAQPKDLGDMMEANDAQAWQAFRHKMDRIHKERPVVALVLGGGGAKGTAHVGVLKYLREQNIPVDMVLGTSMGGLMGSLFSLGYSTEQIEELVSEMDWPSMLSDKVPDTAKSYETRMYKEKYILNMAFDFADNKFKKSIPSAYISGQNVSNLISSLTVGYQQPMNFCDLPIPFACVSTDLIKGKGVVWMSGSLTDALRTTMSLPLVFSAMRKEGRFLVDGGLVNNFPADIAKKLGADIIIGVSVDSPSIEFDDAHNFLDVISLTIDLSGKTTLAKNLSIPDVVIRPDLEGLNALSFSKENVEKLISNGYNAAKDSSALFEPIRKRLGQHVFKTHAPAARSIIHDSIKVKDVHFTGLSAGEEQIMREDFLIKPGQVVNKEILDSKVARIFGTGAFTKVNYRFTGADPDYDLTLDCTKGPNHRFGLGVRFDLEEMVSAVANFGFNAHALYGAMADITLRLSANPYLQLEYGFELPNFPRICAMVDLRYTNTNLMRFAHSPLAMQYFMTNQEVAFDNFNWTLFSLRTGFRNTVAKIFEASVQDPFLTQPTVFTGLFVQAGMDRLRGGEYFPTDGLRMKLGYSWQFKSNLSKSEMFKDCNYHDVSLGLKGAATPSKADFFTFLYSANLRMLFSGNHDNIPLYARNIIGGDIAGRYVPQQIEFCGINNAYMTENAVLSAEMDLRFRLMKNNYITAKGMAAATNRTVYDKFNNIQMIYGCALEYSLSTIIGPIKANVHWSNKGAERMKGFGIAVSAGFNF